jgi:membrane protein required for colicin V production
MSGPINYMDAGLVALVLISAILAMYRGFARELLSITSWAVAALAVLYFVLNHRPFAEDLAPQMGAPVWVAQVVVGAVIFLIVLIVVHLITLRISDSILDSRVGMIDRLLGFVFGMGRGFIIVVIAYMFYEAFFPNPEDQLPWVREAQSLPYVKGVGEAVKTVLVIYMPSSLTSPDGEQQSLINSLPETFVALAQTTKFHISVT